MNNTTIVLYQAYGSKQIHYQVMFSILTLYYHVDGNFTNFKVVVYTDNKSFFKHLDGKIPISLEPIKAKDLVVYKGTDNFIHRVKVCIIQKCFEKYKSNILYLDSDTYFVESPLNLFNYIDNNHSLMNSDDYDLNEAAPLYENTDWLKIRQSIKNYTYSIGENEIRIPLTTRMWNAGVIGISYKNAYLVDHVLELTDQIFKNVKVFTAEQFAFSYYLQTKTQLVSTGETIFHYWQNHTGQFWKDAYSKALQKFFKEHKSKPIKKLTALAYTLSLQHTDIIRSYKPSLMSKFRKRLKLIVQVAKKGKI